MSIPAKAEYRSWIEAVLSRGPQEALAQGGFRRRGVVFDRVIGGVKQVVRFDLVVRPAYARGSAHLVFNVDLSVPEADGVYVESVQSVSGARKPYFLRIAGDSLRKIPGPSWLFADDQQADNLEASVVKVLVEDVVPYLEQRASIADLAAKCDVEIDDEVRESGQLNGDRSLYIAALYSAAGNDNEARRILAASYPEGSRGRAEYGPVIDYYSHRS